MSGQKCEDLSRNHGASYWCSKQKKQNCMNTEETGFAGKLSLDTKFWRAWGQVPLISDLFWGKESRQSDRHCLGSREMLWQSSHTWGEAHTPPASSQAKGAGTTLVPGSMVTHSWNTHLWSTRHVSTATPTILMVTRDRAQREKWQMEHCPHALSLHLIA